MGNEIAGKPRNKGGRPTKFKAEYCELLIKHMGKDGLSYETFAPVVQVNVDTLYHWEKKHPQFSEAKKRAMIENRLFWERIGAAGMVGKIPGFNATLWIFNMKNRHGWRDRIETENRTAITGDLNINANIVGIIEQFENADDGEQENK